MFTRLVLDEEYRYRVQRDKKMNADVFVYLSERLYEDVRRDKSLEQLYQAACLPGVLSPICGMPDLHEGYGLPIGGVMAMATDGLLSAGAVGMDINCGVRLLRTDILSADIDKSKLRGLMDRIEDCIPTGVGKKGMRGELKEVSLEEVAEKGSQILVKRGYGWNEDLERTEENGQLPGGSLEWVSDKAIKRGRQQLSTLGSGNHFIDIQEITEVFDQNLANQFDLQQGNLAVMIHCGSRGFGHQICTDYVDILWDAAQKLGIQIPSRALAAAPIDSEAGQHYYASMAAAVNYAFANRQLIAHDVRAAFADVLGKSAESLGMRMVYDVAHNIAKWEEYGGQRVLVHRKGATRALPAGHPQNPAIYQKTGHPVLIPGSMGTSSYVLVGTEKARESWYSVNHGAGRVMSRSFAKRMLKPKELERALGDDILVNARNLGEILDEAPMVYKNIDEVIDVLWQRGLVEKVAKLRPRGVIIGKE